MTSCQVDIELGASEELINRPDFKKAARAAPHWVRAALKKLNEYEEIIEAGMEYFNTGGGGGEINGPQGSISYKIIDKAFKYVQSFTVDRWYTPMTNAELRAAVSVFIQIMDKRVGESYVREEFDCDNTAMLFKSLAHAFAGPVRNHAIAVAIASAEVGDGHALTVFLSDDGTYKVLDPIMTYRTRAPYFLELDGKSFIYDKTKFTITTLFW